MVKAVFDNLASASPKNHFTVGIDDDVSHTSLEYDPRFVTEAAGRRRLHFLRPRRRRHRWSEQELDQDHRRGDVRATRRASSSTTRRNPGRARHRTSASDRSRSDRRTSCSRRSSSPAINSSSSSASTCSTRRPTARCSCSTAPSVRATSGMNCPERCRRNSSANVSGSTSSTRTAWRSRPACPAGSTPSCRPASSRFQACCRATKRSHRSRMPSRRPTARKGNGTGRAAISRLSIARSRTCTKSCCRPRRRARASRSPSCPRTRQSSSGR